MTDREVVEAVRCGARSVDDVTRRCGGAGNSCGTCRPLIAKYVAVAEQSAVIGPATTAQPAVRPAA